MGVEYGVQGKGFTPFTGLRKPDEGKIGGGVRLDAAGIAPDGLGRCMGDPLDQPFGQEFKGPLMVKHQGGTHLVEEIQ